MTILLLFILYALVLSFALGRAGHQSRTDPAAGTRRETPTKILIIGATGGTGRRLITQALERGLTVTAFVRDPSKLQDPHPNLKVIKGNVLDLESVNAGMRGQDAVLCALGHKRFFYPTRILSEGTRNIIRAMENNGVRRIVFETSLGIGDSAGRMGLYYTLFVIPLILHFYFWDKTRQERIIAASGVDWVIVRPGALTNKEERGAIRHGRVGGFVLTPRIPRADVAHFMLDQLGSSKYLKSAPGIC